MSPPVRGRGLKRDRHAVGAEHQESPPVRGRGLKRFGLRGAPLVGRPPCGGAD